MSNNIEILKRNLSLRPIDKNYTSKTSKQSPSITNLDDPQENLEYMDILEHCQTVLKENITQMKSLDFSSHSKAYLKNKLQNYKKVIANSINIHDLLLKELLTNEELVFNQQIFEDTFSKKSKSNSKRLMNQSRLSRSTNININNHNKIYYLCDKNCTSHLMLIHNDNKEYKNLKEYITMLRVSKSNDNISQFFKGLKEDDEDNMDKNGMTRSRSCCDMGKENEGRLKGRRRKGINGVDEDDEDEIEGISKRKIGKKKYVYDPNNDLLLLEYLKNNKKIKEDEELNNKFISSILKRIDDLKKNKSIESKLNGFNNEIMGAYQGGISNFSRYNCGNFGNCVSSSCCMSCTLRNSNGNRNNIYGDDYSRFKGNFRYRNGNI